MKVPCLFLSNNNFTGSLPPGLFDNPNLYVLSLSQTKFYGELPNDIGNAISIMYLMLDGNNFSGKVPKSINNMIDLIILDLSNNRFSGNIFQNFGILNPYFIDLSSNEFSGEIQIDFLSNTNVLALGKNKFSDSLSRNFTRMASLEYLDIHDNKITSKLPDFICQISTLKILNLRNNSIQGSIPDCISNLTSLRILDLSSNHLVREIPLKFGKLNGMIETSGLFFNDLVFYYNFINLETKVHDLIVNWKKSKQGLSFNNLKLYSLLDLSSNQLFGEIPASLGSLKALKLLNVSDRKSVV